MQSKIDVQGLFVFSIIYNGKRKMDTFGMSSSYNVRKAGTLS